VHIGVAHPDVVVEHGEQRQHFLEVLVGRGKVVYRSAEERRQSLRFSSVRSALQGEERSFEAAQRRSETLQGDFLE
jgi:hypothetical protein